MIDIHSHILPNIDDGSSDIEESLKMVREAAENGFTSIICTSHYISESYNYNKSQREMLIKELQDKAIEENINIQLYNGAEAYISLDLDILIKKDVIPTLNDSKYILFELPMESRVIYVDAVIEKLVNIGLIPILAHPERYTYMHKNFDMYERLANNGVLFQSNLGSIIGRHGDGAKKIVKKLLKKDMIHFLATDAHRPNSMYIKIDEIIKRLGKIISKEKIELLTRINPEKVLNNQDIVE